MVLKLDIEIVENGKITTQVVELNQMELTGVLGIGAATALLTGGIGLILAGSVGLLALKPFVANKLNIPPNNIKDIKYRSFE